MLAELAAHRARVAELQAQIVPLERALARLRLEQSQVQKQLDSFTYPVLTLPNEITSVIFIHFLPPHPDFPPLTGPLSPALLTRICRQWRDVALSTPQLWSAISSFDNNERGRELRIFELWLKRSRSCPLHLKLRTDEYWADDKLVEAIIPHRARWEHLKIDFHMDNFQLFGGPMPLLRHLALVLGHGSDDEISLHNVPLLRTVALNSPAVTRTALPWAQLTSLTLLPSEASACVSVLERTPNLVHCELHLFFPSPSNIDVRRDITLKCLECLVLMDYAGPAKADFLPTFVVPALRSLRIPESFLSPNPIRSLAAVLSKSHCKLEELHLCGVKLTVPENSYRQEFSLLQKFSFGSR
ncbi:hypothetical protein DFH06DRAFT_1338184 [Mycena polygramma]|nr:hypothetical protein DFH06DRAFT_1338184 [Mycena polygramma]